MAFFSRPASFRPDGFVVGIVVAAAVASIFPATGAAETALTWVTRISVGLLFFLYGARLSPREAIDGVKHWRLHTVVLASTFILFPLIGLALRILAPTILTDDLYTGVLFLCLVPSTVQSSIAFTSIARGNVAGAVVSASLSNILGVFITPALVILLMAGASNGGSGSAAVGTSAIVDIVLQLLAPFVLGQLVRPLITGWLTRHAKPTKLVDRSSILFIVYSAFSASKNEHVWSALSAWRIVAVVVVCLVLLGIVLGATTLAGRWLGFPLADRIVVLFCGSKKSLASGLPMATVLFVGQPIGVIVLPLLIFHQIQLIVCAVLAGRFERAADVREKVETAARL